MTNIRSKSFVFALLFDVCFSVLFDGQNTDGNFGKIECRFVTSFCPFTVLHAGKGSQICHAEDPSSGTSAQIGDRNFLRACSVPKGGASTLKRLQVYSVYFRSFVYVSVSSVFSAARGSD